MDAYDALSKALLQEELVGKKDEIKSDVSVGFRVIVHLDSEDQVKQVPLGIKRRSLIFKLDF
jgi:hypothetical protein